MSGSPGLLASIQALILANLDVTRINKMRRESGSEDQPFVLLADIVLFAQIDKVCDRLGGKKLKAIHNVNLRKGKVDGVS